jgi:hypothetical protein
MGKKLHIRDFGCSFFEKRFFHGEKKSQSQPIGMKNSEKTRFLTTSPRKMIFDIFLVYK